MSGAEPSYPQVGATAGALPDGYHHLRVSTIVGAGRDDFLRAAHEVTSWGMHRAVVSVVEAPPAAVVGAVVRMRYGGLSFGCVVVDVEDADTRRGFAYGTLPGHPERGEERFVVVHDPATDEVRLEITAFSRPGRALTRLLGPAGRLLQRRITARYVAAVRSAVDRE